MNTRARITVRMARNKHLADADGDWGVGEHYLSIAGYHLDPYFRDDEVANLLEKRLEKIMLAAHDKKILHNRIFYGHRMICGFWKSATEAERGNLVDELEEAIAASLSEPIEMKESDIDKAFFAAFERGDYDEDI